MDKKNLVILVVVLLIISGLFIGLKYWIPSHDLFSYNLMEILTTVIVTVGIYFLTKVNDEIKSKNEKVEDTVEWIRDKLNSVFNCTIKKDKQAEYLHTFKYLDNKIVVLEKLSKHLNCDDEIKEIINEKQKLDDFISENIGQGDSYFIGDTVKEKIPNILCNIETHLDTIVLKIYEN